MQKKLLALLLLPFTLHLFYLCFFQFNTHFHTRDFEHGFDKTYAEEVSGLDYSQLDEIFNQPFHFLGQGKQMTAFESADGKYVLKLFNPMCPLKEQWYLNWNNWKRVYSLRWISHEWLQKKNRLQKLFKRHQIAFSELRSETGLLFVHLHPSNQVCHFVHVEDRNGKRHILSLNQTPFVLQEKAVLAAQYFDKLVKENKLQEATEAIASMRLLFEKRLQLGITDRIQTMENNYGFVGTKPIQLDVGRIRLEPELLTNPNEEHMRILGNFHLWLKNRYPQSTLLIQELKLN